MGSSAASLQQAAHDLSLNMLLTGTLSLSENGYQFDMELVRGSNGDQPPQALQTLQYTICRTIEAFRACTALACAWIRLQLYVDTA